MTRARWFAMVRVDGPFEHTRKFDCDESFEGATIKPSVTPFYWGAHGTVSLRPVGAQAGVILSIGEHNTKPCARCGREIHFFHLNQEPKPPPGGDVYCVRGCKEDIERWRKRGMTGGTTVRRNDLALVLRAQAAALRASADALESVALAIERDTEDP